MLTYKQIQLLLSLFQHKNTRPSQHDATLMLFSNIVILNLIFGNLDHVLLKELSMELPFQFFTIAVDFIIKNTETM